MLFCAVLTIFNPNTYSSDDDGYLNISIPGIVFAITSIFRFYSFSYFINDIKLAQSIYFYGSLSITFIIINLYFLILFNVAKGNIMHPGVQVNGQIFSVLDPTFGWFLIILFQNNFAGILTQNTGAPFFGPDIAGGTFECSIIGMLVYGGIFIFVTERGYRGCCGYSTAANTATNLIQSNVFRIEDTPVSTTSTHVPSTAADSERMERLPGSEDPDVIRERQRVQAIVDRHVLNLQQSAIFISNLTKVYCARGNAPAKIAVNKLNISIPKGEIFGLLGANGAGKSTLLKMVSGQVSLSFHFPLLLLTNTLA